MKHGHLVVILRSYQVNLTVKYTCGIFRFCYVSYYLLIYFITHLGQNLGHSTDNRQFCRFGLVFFVVLIIQAQLGVAHLKSLKNA